MKKAFGAFLGAEHGGQLRSRQRPYYIRFVIPGAYEDAEQAYLN